MSGFDNSQPIAEEAALEDVDEARTTAKPKDSDAARAPAEPDELGDATPGPR
jgi:hypothetical protein